MNELPRMKRLQEKKNLSLKIDPEVEKLYRIGRANGWDVSEIARQAITETFKRIADQLKRQAS